MTDRQISILQRLVPLLCIDASAQVGADLQAEPGDPALLQLDLRADVGLDAIALAELLVAIEEEFDIAIEGAEIDGCLLLRDLVRLIQIRTADQPSATASFSPPQTKQG